LSAALQDPQAIAGLALIAPLTHFVPTVPPPFRALAIRTHGMRQLFAHTLAVPLAILNSRKTLALVFGPEPAPKDFPVRGGGLLGLRPEAFRGASVDMVAVEQDLPAQQLRYGELRLPIHVLYGDGGPGAGLAHARRRTAGHAARREPGRDRRRRAHGAGHAAGRNRRLAGARRRAGAGLSAAFSGRRPPGRRRPHRAHGWYCGTQRSSPLCSGTVQLSTAAQYRSQPPRT
jgi:hypothetical protein